MLIPSALFLLTMPDDLELDQEFLVGLFLAWQRLDLVTFLVHYLYLDVTWNDKQFTVKSFLFCSTFNFMFFVGRTMHKFKIPMKYLFTSVINNKILNPRI